MKKLLPLVLMVTVTSTQAADTLSSVTEKVVNLTVQDFIKNTEQTEERGLQIKNDVINSSKLSKDQKKCLTEKIDFGFIMNQGSYLSNIYYKANTMAKHYLAIQESDASDAQNELWLSNTIKLDQSEMSKALDELKKVQKLGADKIKECEKKN